MTRRRKITYTLYIDENDNSKTVGRKLTARRIRSIALAKGEKMSEWADELGVSRQYISQVVNGKRTPKKVRNFIEARLGQTFWSETTTKEVRS
ncbi:hypothetical protein DSCW_18570 [Desulfosarcina widdelii]|uniref:HTH cro/C1-type domain-containing protein n=1 Tax=Desulfosarcina widdelii TaxID=947919 RepID=A0A5K7Z197_9BACT|nr:helix-turn-helix transcriptional regulator [Desulfosarcina widdelii]BBO74440.1 hypothetical protein DSCW_18570 [Desulfosarcina widdelii]